MRTLAIALSTAALLAACGGPQPTEGEIQVALSNCFVASDLQPDEEAAVHECSQELSRIGAIAFVAKYRTK